MKENMEQPKATAERQNISTEMPLVELTRTFRAPVERVWAAWSRPELVKQWWGPEEYTSPRADIDFTEGGRFIFGMRSPQGDVNWSAGSVMTIEPNRKIVFSETFATEDGKAITPKEAGMNEWQGDYQGTITIELQNLGSDQTQMTIRHTGIPANLHDECVDGWSSSFKKLQKLVEQH